MADGAAVSRSGDIDAGPAPTADAGCRAPAPRQRPGQDDALDLGATVLPVLLKGYWKQGVAALVVVAIWLLIGG